MNNTMEYKGYTGSVEFSEEDALFYGKVLGIRSLLSYEYLEACLEEGTEPERAYKGSFNVRIDPELHKQTAIYAAQHQTTLNGVVESALKQFVSAR